VINTEKNIRVHKTHTNRAKLCESLLLWERFVLFSSETCFSLAHHFPFEIDDSDLQMSDKISLCSHNKYWVFVSFLRRYPLKIFHVCVYLKLTSGN
jgi:hypothetical protein